MVTDSCMGLIFNCTIVHIIIFLGNIHIPNLQIQQILNNYDFRRMPCELVAFPILINSLYRRTFPSLLVLVTSDRTLTLDLSPAKVQHVLQEDITGELHLSSVRWRVSILQYDVCYTLKATEK